MLPFLMPAILFAIAQAPISEASVTGTVVDSITRVPVAGATLTLFTLDAIGDAASSAKTTTSGAKGEYAFPNATPGRCAITIKKTGYATIDSFLERERSIFTLSAGQSLRRDYALVPAGSISGRLFDDESGEPLLGLSVRALREDYFGGQKRYVPAGAGKSDDKGVYRIENLGAGRYWLEIASTPVASIQAPAPKVEAQRPSYGRSYYPGVSSFEMASPVMLLDSQHDRLDMRLRKRTIGRVMGVLEAASSAPISLQVQQNAPGLYRMIASAVVKPGPFQISDLDEGEYVVVAATTGEAPGEKLFAEQHLSMGARDVEDFNLVLQPGLTIEGSVRLAEGEEGPLPAGIWVGLDPVERGRTDMDKNVRAGATGEFRLEGRRPGEYWPYSSVAFGRPAQYKVMEIRYGGSNVKGGSIVPGSAIGGGKLEFIITSRLGSILGSVRDAEDDLVSGATVVLFPFPIADMISPYEIRTTVSAAQGDFNFTGLAPGRYKAVALVGPDARRYLDAGLVRSKTSLSPIIEVDAASVVKATIKP